jgi:hypothetical protein
MNYREETKNNPCSEEGLRRFRGYPFRNGRSVLVLASGAHFIHMPNLTKVLPSPIFRREMPRRRFGEG